MACVFCRANSTVITARQMSPPERLPPPRPRAIAVICRSRPVPASYTTLVAPPSPAATVAFLPRASPLLREQPRTRYAAVTSMPAFIRYTSYGTSTICFPTFGVTKRLPKPYAFEQTIITAADHKIRNRDDTLSARVMTINVDEAYRYATDMVRRTLRRATSQLNTAAFVTQTLPYAKIALFRHA